MPDINELSDREREILHLVATGASNKEIARDLYISSNTVKVHLRNIFAKIGVASRTEAAMYAVSAGLVEPITSPDGEGMTVKPGDGNLNTGTGALAERPRKAGLTPSWTVLIGILLVALVVVISLFISRQANPVSPGDEGNAVQIVPRWRELSSLPVPSQGSAVAAFENSIFSIGGKSPQEVTGSVLRFNLETNSWNTMHPKPTAVKDAQAAVLGGKIYVPGGCGNDSQPTDLLEIYDPRKDTWENGAPLPGPLCGYALAPFEGKIYIFGGWDGENYLGTVLVYDPDLDEWDANASPMPTARAYAGAAVAGGNIYVIGGTNGEKTLEVNEVYQPDLEGGELNPWNEAEPMPEGRAQMGVSSLADIVYVFGGVSEDRQPVPAIKYSPSLDSWEALEEPRTEDLSDLGLVHAETKLYLVGGNLDGEPTDRVLEYQAIYTVVFPVVR